MTTATRTSSPETAMRRTGTYNLSHNHGAGTTAGFLVVLTDWAAGFPCQRTVVAEVVGETNYLRALELVNQVRDTAEADQYGVIDTVYTCGCETDGFRVSDVVPAVAEYRAMNCDERHRVFRAMGATVRPMYLRHLGWDEVEFLAESAFLSRDHVYRDQVIGRLVELGQFPSAIAGYRRAAADQDAARGYWAGK